MINLSVQVFGQDVVPRQAPIDNMSSFEDSMKNDKGDDPDFTKIPIIIDSTEGWEWIDNEKAEYVFETYPLRMSYNKYLSHPQYRVFNDEVYNGNGQIVRVISILESNCNPRGALRAPITDELLRQTYINDYKTNKYNFKKENQIAQNYVKKELKLITSSRFYWSKEGVRYLQQLNLDHIHDFYSLKNRTFSISQMTRVKLA